MLNPLRKLKALLQNVITIRTAELYERERWYYMEIFKTHYTRYKRWIEPKGGSTLAIDVIIPVIEKDLAVLPQVINGIRQHVKHPLKSIYIVAPANAAIIACAEANNAVFVDEKRVCDISKQQINYVVNGINRSGWLYQQFLKLNFDKVSTTENYLVVDADTVFIKNIQFEGKGLFYFDFSDEYHLPYYKAYEILTGLKHRVEVSFVAHYMFFSKVKLAELKAQIGKHTGTKTENAIIGLVDVIKDLSNFSEYETYANYCIHTQPEKYRLRYWFNKTCPSKDLAEIEKLKKDKTYKSISFHAYN